jgi:hypothetical protein
MQYLQEKDLRSPPHNLKSKSIENLIAKIMEANKITKMF